jgi:hypothetical protein
MLMKIEGAIKNGQSREIGNIGHTGHRTKTKKQKKQQDICWTPLCASKDK